MLTTDNFPIPSSSSGEVERALAESVAHWADREVISRRHDLGEDPDRLLAPALDSLMGELGLQTAPWPEDLGGLGEIPPGCATTRVAALEQVGRADVGLALLLASADALAAALAADRPAVEIAAPLFCGTERAAVPALILPTLGQAGDSPPDTVDGRRPQAVARRSGKGWRVDGVGTRPVSSGHDASCFGVTCAVEDEGTTALFVVRGDLPGISRTPLTPTLGLAASRDAHVTFEAVRVPDGARCGVSAADIAETWLHAGTAAACLGGLLAVHTILDDWAESRVIKGRGMRFKANPLTARLMGDVAARIQQSRLLVYDLAGLLTRGTDEHAAVRSVARSVVASADAAIHTTMELMGSAGYAQEWQLERIWRDTRAMGALLGPQLTTDLAMARSTFGCTAR